MGSDQTNCYRYLTVDEARSLLPVRVAERVFRKAVRELGFCYINGHQITLSPKHLSDYIETL